jgi:hypothetical protein
MGLFYMTQGAKFKTIYKGYQFFMNGNWVKQTLNLNVKTVTKPPLFTGIEMVLQSATIHELSHSTLSHKTIFIFKLPKQFCCT